MLRWTVRSGVGCSIPLWGHHNYLSIVASSSTDVWAVGDSWRENGLDGTVVLHFNGRRWSRVVAPSPRISGRLPVVSSVSASSTRSGRAAGHLLGMVKVAKKAHRYYGQLVRRYDRNAYGPRVHHITRPS